MIDRLRKLKNDALKHQIDLSQKAGDGGNLAYQLAAQSMSSHIDDLSQQIALLDERPIFEFLEFRLIASKLRDGSIPLSLLAKVVDEIRQMIGHAALRLSQGGMWRKRVSKDLYNDLDLRLAAILPGSSRLVISTSAQRDLFDDGLSKNAFERIFKVLDSQGEGGHFLEAVTDLGPASARRLREFLHLLRSNSAELQLSWRYSGNTVKQWNGDSESIVNVAFALDSTELIAKDSIELEGYIELLSKRERIHLTTDDSRTIRILFPKRLLRAVSELHLDQRVKLLCSVTETENPLTGESSIFYELEDIID
ncbi:hypothetical protein SAMN02745119_00236 [Trichlorobacter thiogenes]|uniref:Uncharacterized protein n=1 Tax=Trichlorobacter thiogenes TaxID=115783 RepID=A0A1T4K0U8_9BACT|nr:hypothetical protein [Trichlorobacter thiogenes]SJZ36041.1 hypothetical protein SAMN02745119_00236 [Trichlorobacter thiogenes]